MAEWTYGENLEDSARDRVRNLIGDTTQRSYSPSDSEIEYWLSVHTDGEGNVDEYGAAIDVATMAARRYRTLSKGSEVTIGGMSLKTKYSDIADGWDTIVQDLMAGRNPADDIGGIRTASSQPDSVFRIGMMDYGA